MIYFYMTSKSNDLQHHGIMGQKWGVRRFQNRDGSLTGAGRKRYSDDGQQKSSSSDRKEKAKSVAKKVAVAAGVAAGVAAVAGVSYLVYKNKKASSINSGRKAVEAVNKNKTLETLRKEMQNRDASVSKIMAQVDSLNNKANTFRNTTTSTTQKTSVPKTTTKRTTTSSSLNKNLAKELERRRRAMERTMSAFDTLDRSARR